MRGYNRKQRHPSLPIISRMTTIVFCMGVFALCVGMFTAIFVTPGDPPVASAGPIVDSEFVQEFVAGGNAATARKSNTITDIGKIISTDNINNPVKTLISKDKSLKMSIVAGTKGFCHPQRWMPVKCLLENSGPSTNGYIEIIPGSNNREQGVLQPTVYRKKLDLPRNARKKVDINVLADNPLITVKYVADNKTILRTSMHARWVNSSCDLIGVLARDDSSLSLFDDVTSANRGSEYALFYDISELPESDLGLNSLDIIVLNGVSTQKLSVMQRKAILDWVRDGGTLVLGGGGGNAAKTIAGLPKELVPVTIGATTTSPKLPAALNPTLLGPRTSQSADSYADSYSGQGPYSYTKVNSFQGEVILGDEQTPIAVQKTTGNGNVIWVAFDLCSRPFSEWRTNEAFWSKIMAHREMRNSYIRTDFISGTLSGLLYNVSSLKAPSLSHVMLFLFLYFILVSPLNYFLLKRFDKREWAWITIPLSIVLFGTASYWYAYMTKGGDIIVNQVGVLDISPDENNARLYSAFGIYSPGKTSYVIELPDGMSGAPTPEMFEPMSMGGLDPAIVDLSRQPQMQIRDFSVAAWTLRSFIATGRIDLAEKPVAILRYTKKGIDGSIKNNLPYPLTDSFLMDGKRIYKIGTLKADSTKTIALQFDKSIPVNESIGENLFASGKKRIQAMGRPDAFSQKTMSKIEMVNQMFCYDGSSLPKSPTLVAWASHPMETPGIMGKKPIYHGQIMIMLPVAINMTDYFAINSLRAFRTITNKTGTVRDDNPEYMSFSKTIELEYSLPINHPYTPVLTTFLYSAAGPPRSYKIYIFNFKSNAFSEFKNLKNWSDIKPPAEYIGPDNTIRLKLEANKDQWGEITSNSLYFEVHGTWLN